MSDNNNINIGVSLNYCNKKLTEFPKELYEHKNTLYNLDLSANPLLDLDKAINELKEFKSLKRLKINIETGEEAKKVIQALPFLQYLNDIKIQEEEEKNNNNSENVDKNLADKEKETDNIFDKILEKIKEYDNITKEKYDLIINDYNKLIQNHKIKNTLEICSYFNKILINLIKDAQESGNIKISSLKPLLEAQTQNESIRINYESKINIKNKININDISLDSPREKIKQVKTETASISFVNSNKNIINNHITNKKIIKRNNSITINSKIKNKNDKMKEYSKNIKNLSKSKNKKMNNDTKSEIENDKSNKNFINNSKIDNYFSEKKNKNEFSQQSRNTISNINKNQKNKKKI